MEEKTWILTDTTLRKLNKVEFENLSKIGIRLGKTQSFPCCICTRGCDDSCWNCDDAVCGSCSVFMVCDWPPVGSIVCLECEKLWEEIQLKK